MKRSILIIIAGLAFGAMSRTTQAYEAKYYSSRAALIGSSGAESASPAPMESPRNQSTKISLPGVRQRVIPSDARPVSLALYNTRVAILAARTTEIDLAPM
jgi:hypothetical protein